jgi:hypothetical protein
MGEVAGVDQECVEQDPRLVECGPQFGQIAGIAMRQMEVADLDRVVAMGGQLAGKFQQAGTQDRSGGAETVGSRRRRILGDVTAEGAVQGPRRNCTRPGITVAVPGWSASSVPGRRLVRLTR